MTEGGDRASDSARVLLHVGYHKTASTWLQDFVFPAIGARLIRTPSVKDIALSDSFNRESFLQSIGMDAHRGATIISQERFSGCRDGHPSWDAFRIARRLHSAFPGARVLIVVRQQFDFILSLYAYVVGHRGLETRSLRSYLEGCPGLVEKLCYDELVAAYRELFGEARVLVLPYEQLVADPVRFVRRIAAIHDLDAPSDVVTTKANASVRDRRVLWMYRLLNAPAGALIRALEWSGADRTRVIQARRSWYRLKRGRFARFLQHLSADDAWQIQVDSESRQRLEPRFAASNLKLAQLADFDLMRYGYPMPPGSPPRIGASS